MLYIRMYRKSITSRDVYTLGYLQPSINIPNIVFVDSRLINLVCRYFIMCESERFRKRISEVKTICKSKVNVLLAGLQVKIWTLGCHIVM